MRILLLCHAFNGLAQRAFLMLRRAGHEVSVEFDVHDRLTEEAVALFRPDLVVAPFLKRAIPESVWRRVRCLVVHPGIPGDRGPSSLDWAILEGERDWGVSIIEANGEMDGGPLWASEGFALREAGKASLYRREVGDAAMAALATALARIESGTFVPAVPQAGEPGVRGRARPPVRREDREVRWAEDSTEVVLRKLRASDSEPGVPGELLGVKVRMFDPHAEDVLRGGRPGEPFARRDGALLVGTRDGAVWIGQLRRDDGAAALKRPAVAVLGAAAEALPERALDPFEPVTGQTFRDLWVAREGPVARVHFPFAGGALDPARARRLAAVLARLRESDARVVALMGGPEFWCNGIHLHAIEASAHPADASWESINAIDDLALEILTNDRQLTVAALQGNAGAGGVFLALAADHVLVREGTVLNPHYKGMGNLYGSEYWTYLLPRRVGEARAEQLTRRRLPVDARGAVDEGLCDELGPAGHAAFAARVRALCRDLAGDGFAGALERKRAARAADEAAKPLAAYRAEELARMRLNFYGFDPSYHVARHQFTFRTPKSRTPLYLAPHRRLRPEEATA